jgi:hypothetical protein
VEGQRRGLPWDSPQALRDLAISVGAEGSGTRELAMELFRAIGLDATRMRISPLPTSEAAEALLRGDLDFMAIVGSWQADVVRKLLASDRVTLMPFVRADAHIALRPFLAKFVVPRGVGNMALDLPPQDVPLVGPRASLLVVRDLHPAIQYLLLDAASEVHAQAALFQAAGQFPAAEPSEVPLSPEARNYYRSGPPFLQRYLPFWVAVLIGRLAIVLVPIVGVAYPLLRMLPALYGWSFRRRIFRLYGELKFLEAELEARSPDAPVGDLVARLEELERRASHMRVPVAFAHLLYTMRIHAQMVRAGLERRSSTRA